MSQPTLSRLKIVPDWRTLARIGLGLIDLYYRSFRTPPKLIVLDRLVTMKRTSAPMGIASTTITGTITTRGP